MSPASLPGMVGGCVVDTQREKVAEKAERGAALAPSADRSGKIDAPKLGSEPPYEVFGHHRYFCFSPLSFASSSATHAAHTGFRVNPSNGFGFMGGLDRLFRRFGFLYGLSRSHPGQSRANRHQHAAMCLKSTTTSRTRITRIDNQITAAFGTAV